MYVQAYTVHSTLTRTYERHVSSGARNLVGLPVARNFRESLTVAARQMKFCTTRIKLRCERFGSRSSGITILGIGALHSLPTFRSESFSFIVSVIIIYLSWYNINSLMCVCCHSGSRAIYIMHRSKLRVGLHANESTVALHRDADTPFLFQQRRN